MSVTQENDGLAQAVFDEPNMLGNLDPNSRKKLSRRQAGAVFLGVLAAAGCAPKGLPTTVVETVVAATSEPVLPTVGITKVPSTEIPTQIPVPTEIKFAGGGGFSEEQKKEIDGLVGYLNEFWKYWNGANNTRPFNVSIESLMVVPYSDPITGKVMIALRVPGEPNLVTFPRDISKTGNPILLPPKDPETNEYIYNNGEIVGGQGPFKLKETLDDGNTLQWHNGNWVWVDANDRTIKYYLDKDGERLSVYDFAVSIKGEGHVEGLKNTISIEIGFGSKSIKELAKLGINIVEIRDNPDQQIDGFDRYANSLVMTMYETWKVQNPEDQISYDAYITKLNEGQGNIQFPVANANITHAQESIGEGYVDLSSFDTSGPALYRNGYWNPMQGGVKVQDVWEIRGLTKKTSPNGYATVGPDGSLIVQSNDMGSLLTFISQGWSIDDRSIGHLFLSTIGNSLNVLTASEQVVVRGGMYGGYFNWKTPYSEVDKIVLELSNIGETEDINKRQPPFLVNLKS